MRETTADEAASQEAGAIASRIFPIDVRKVGIFDRRAALKRGRNSLMVSFFICSAVT
jgi:hypothetical protein